MVKRNYTTKNMAYDMPWHDRVPYTLGDGVEVPSVTEVLSMVGNADGLVNWGVFLQRNGIDWKEERNHLGDIGTTTHSYIEQYIKTLQIPDMLDFGGVILTLAKPPILAFHDWFTARTVTPHATELRMVSETWEIGGTADLIAYVDGEFEVIDFKTGAKNVKNKIQVAAYVKLARENGMNVTRGRLVHLDRQYSSKGQPQYSEIIIEEDEIDEYFAAFDAAKVIYEVHKPKKRKGKIMPFEDSGPAKEPTEFVSLDIPDGTYKVKYVDSVDYLGPADEHGNRELVPGAWGGTSQWMIYDVFSLDGQRLSTDETRLRNMITRSTDEGTKTWEHAKSLGYVIPPNTPGEVIHQNLVGKEAIAHIKKNEKGHLTIESLSPITQPGGGVASAGESNSPF